MNHAIKNQKICSVKFDNTDNLVLVSIVNGAITKSRLNVQINPIQPKPGQGWSRQTERHDWFVSSSL